MNKIRAILVDDEESARDVLQNLLLRFCPEVQLIAKCGDVKEAVNVIKKEQPHLVFLDIQMPNYAGYEIVKFFQEVNFKIIFVTAYDQYAIRAFEVAALDYLLKPIDIDRLKEAVERAVHLNSLKQQAMNLSLLSNSLQSKSLTGIVVIEKGQRYVLAIEDIIAVEALESYCFIHTIDKKYTVSKNLKHFEMLFEPLPRFIRTHKSWLINKEHLLHYSKSDFTIKLKGNLIAKLSKYKKSEFEEAILN